MKPFIILSTASPAALVTELQRKKDFTSDLQRLTVVKRSGSLVPFRQERIRNALVRAFKDTKKDGKEQSLSEDLSQEIETIVNSILLELHHLSFRGATLTVEGIQDQVEIHLMKRGHHDVARDYIVYRDQHKTIREDSPLNLKITRSDHSVARFNPMKIAASLDEAFCKAEQRQSPAERSVIDAINRLTQNIVAKAVFWAKSGIELTSYLIDDETEKQLMKEGFFEAAKQFILQRSSLKESEVVPPPIFEKRQERRFAIIEEDQNQQTLTEAQLLDHFQFACRGFEGLVSAEDLLESMVAQGYVGIKAKEIDQACIMTARAKIELEPAYSQVAARLLLDVLYRETMQIRASEPSLESIHKEYFKAYLKRAIEMGRINPELLDFDLDKLARAMQLQRDDSFSYLGLQTLYDRYFLCHEEIRMETPQIFWMRVAMGLALNEGAQRTEKAIEFYDLFSRFLFCSDTPTLLNSGTNHPQLSSCYLSTVTDDLGHIFKVISDNAQLSKWEGGLGNDWTRVRATGAHIKGTNSKSEGVIPFLKVASDTAVAVNQGGKRKGAVCAYLETWHLDIEDFLELHTHDMHTANWIPDLFMKRVLENGHWTLFSPSDVPDLHDLYGQAFEERYLDYEAMTETGEIKLFKCIEAPQLWRNMLSMLLKTGHPWITFKDPSNIRSPQDHQGVIHCSNLGTEILLNNSKEETAVCNLGSVNLAEHVTSQGIDEKKLEKTVRTAVRMLDNVIDINFYPTEEARQAHLRHRPIGLGLMGFQDALYILGLSYASHEAVCFADMCMEMISYYALLASSELAKEREVYSSYKDSKWDRGLLPIDTLALLEKERGGHLEMDTSFTFNWNVVRESIRKYGMRNSNTMAIAPATTISTIMNCTPSIDPTYKHLFVKSDGAQYTISNPFLVKQLKELNLWDQQMLDDLKYFDGSVDEIAGVPQEIKRLFPTAFEIDAEWIIECTSRRQKWIDMGISHHLYMTEPSEKKLHRMYLFAWKKGLKTTYKLRCL